MIAYMYITDMRTGRTYRLEIVNRLRTVKEVGCNRKIINLRSGVDVLLAIHLSLKM